MGKLSGKSDEDLAAEAAEGSRSSFDMLVGRYSEKLYLFINRGINSPDESGDILQDTFIKVYRNINRFNSRWKFSTWIYTIASREMVSYFRKRSVKKKYIPEGKNKTAENPEENFFKRETGNIWKLAKKLKPSWYNILWLKYSEGMSNTEIAEVTGRSAISVRVILHRSCKQIALLYRLEESPELYTVLPGSEKLFVRE